MRVRKDHPGERDPEVLLSSAILQFFSCNIIAPHATKGMLKVPDKLLS